MKSRIKHGLINNTDVENASVESEHFKEAFSRDTTVDWIHLSNIRSKRIILSVGDPLSFTELKEAIERLTWDEIPGINGV